MATPTLTLTAEQRTGAGTRAAALLRRNGKLPAITYGHGIATESLVLSAREFGKVYHAAGENTIITLTVGGKARPVLIHDVQRDPLTSVPTHADLFQVRMDEKITADVPLVFVGVAPAVKELAGVLLKNHDALKITALPADLPHEISIDISTLATFDDVITVKDVTLPAGVETALLPEEVIAVVKPPRSEEEIKALEEAVTEDVESVSAVEKKVKEGEEAAEGEAVEGEAEKGAPAAGGAEKKAETKEKKPEKKEKKEKK